MLPHLFYRININTIKKLNLPTKKAPTNASAYLFPLKSETEFIKIDIKTSTQSAVLIVGTVSIRALQSFSATSLAALE